MNLKDIYIFEGLSKDELDYFLTIGKRKLYKKGEEIIKEGDKSNDKAYIIESGAVDVVQKGQKIAEVHEGDIFGEIALIVNEPRIFSVITKEDSYIIEFIKNDFLMLYKKSGEFEKIKKKILDRIKSDFYFDKSFDF